MRPLLPGPATRDLPDRLLAHTVGAGQSTRRLSTRVPAANLADRFPVQPAVPVIFTRDDAIWSSLRAMPRASGSSAERISLAQTLGLIAEVQMLRPHADVVTARSQDVQASRYWADCFFVDPAVRPPSDALIREARVAIGGQCTPPEPAFAAAVRACQQQREQLGHRRPCYPAGGKRVVKTAKEPPGVVSWTALLRSNLGGASGIRTPDPLPARQVLSR